MLRTGMVLSLWWSLVSVFGDLVGDIVGAQARGRELLWGRGSTMYPYPMASPGTRSCSPRRGCV